MHPKQLTDFQGDLTGLRLHASEATYRFPERSHGTSLLFVVIRIFLLDVELERSPAACRGCGEYLDIGVCSNLEYKAER